MTARYRYTRWERDHLTQCEARVPISERDPVDVTPVAIVVALAAIIASGWFLMVCKAIEELFR